MNDRGGARPRLAAALVPGRWWRSSLVWALPLLGDDGIRLLGAGKSRRRRRSARGQETPANRAPSAPLSPALPARNLCRPALWSVLLWLKRLGAVLPWAAAVRRILLWAAASSSPFPASRLVAVDHEGPAPRRQDWPLIRFFSGN
jgi:hypothetical protein